MVKIRAKAEEFKMARMRKGIKQKQLAGEIQRTVKTVSDIERDAVNVGEETAAKICEVLGVKFDRIFEFRQGE